MSSEHPPDRATPALFKILFFILAVLVLASIGYAGWMISTYWGQISV